jgi:hypothetical protein
MILFQSMPVMKYNKYKGERSKRSPQHYPFTQDHQEVIKQEEGTCADHL